MSDNASAMREDKKRKLMARLARIEGQVRAIRRMVEEDKDCEQIAQQMGASRNAMNKAFYDMMACAIEMEVAPHAEEEGVVRDKLTELTKVLAKYG